MFRKYGLLFVLLMLVPAAVRSQDTDPGPGYQMAMMNNPAFSGIEGRGILRLSYLNFFPGHGYNLHSVYFSYDSFYPSLHGGAGFYLTDEYLGGIINDIRGGFSYAYFLQAGEDFFINAGLSGSVFYRGFNFDDAVLPDQIDPLGGVSLPRGELLGSPGKTGFDIAAGFAFVAGRLAGGLSVSHLAEPGFSSSGFPDEKFRRKFMLHLTGDLSIGSTGRLFLRPVGYAGLQGGLIYGGAGAVLENEYFSFNAVVLQHNSDETDVQTGLSAGTGKLRIFYNYRFSVVSAVKTIPLSLLHQTGIALSLNNVEKRKGFKTINFPKM